MKNCSFASPTKLEIGRDAENKTGRLIRERNGSRVLIHYGSGRVRESGLLSRVEESLREAGLTWVEPVSYTHLDVYKRQGHPRGG